MRKIFNLTAVLSAASVAGLAFLTATPPASAQAFLHYDPWGAPICSGPLGPGRCADIAAWMARQQAPLPPSAPGPGPLSGPLSGPIPGSWQAAAEQAGIPRDGVLVAQIGQQCGPDPVCMAAAWGSIELSRCANGIGVPGGCLGPNGEIAKRLPENLQPGTIIKNVGNDIQNGPGPNNDLVGTDGFVCNLLGC